MTLRTVVLNAILLVFSPSARSTSPGSSSFNPSSPPSSWHQDSNRSTQREFNSIFAQFRMIQRDLEGITSMLGSLYDGMSPSFAVRPDAGCPPYWSYDGAKRCYLIPGITATWFGASVLCPAIDSRARLVSVHLDNEQFVEKVINASTEVHEVWAGGVRLRQGGIDWGWQDGTPYDFHKWAPGASGTNVGEDCIIMRGPKSTYPAQVGQWHDGFCCHPNSHFHFMCQITLS